MLRLLRRYWDEMVSYDGGMSLLMMDGLLLVPLIFAAFFYPVQVLALIGALVVLSLVVYEGVHIWRKHHPHHQPPHARV
jgi:hypothetical protein